MKNALSTIKSSFHDIRCCDEKTTTTVGNVTTAWRALASSLTCVLGLNQQNTGYVNVGTLEEYNTGTGVATGNTKPNIAGAADYIANYIDATKCQVGNTSNTDAVYASNGNSGNMAIIMTNTVTNETFNFDVPNGTSLTFVVPKGSYDTEIRVTQNLPLAVNLIVNSSTQVIAGGALFTATENTPLNISSRPTNELP